MRSIPWRIALIGLLILMGTTRATSRSSSPPYLEMIEAAQAGCIAAHAAGLSPRAARGPSHHNLRIDGLEFTARIVDLHLPVDTALRAIDVGGPRRDFAVQGPEVTDAAPA